MQPRPNGSDPRPPLSAADVAALASTQAIADIANGMLRAMDHDPLAVAGGLVVIAAMLVAADDDESRAVLARILQRRAHELDPDVLGVPRLT